MMRAVRPPVMPALQKMTAGVTRATGSGAAEIMPGALGASDA